MSSVLVSNNDICIARYEGMHVSSSGNIVVCGNCNLSFNIKNYIKIYTSGGNSRYISNCPHCGKWNKMRKTIGQRI